MRGAYGQYAAVIKDRVTTRDMMAHVGMRIGRGGMAVCPFHGDGDASLKVYDDPRRGWYCFGCHAGGDAIDFARRWYGISFVEAVERINAEFALGLPIGERMTDAQRRAMREEIERAQRARDEARRRENEAESAYWAAFDAWFDNENTLIDNAPRGHSEPNEAWCAAVVRREELGDALEYAQERWRSLREERYGRRGEQGRPAAHPQQ